MRYWKYKAYDKNYQRVDGVTYGDNHILIILKLRQRGFQIYDLSTIQFEEYTKLLSLYRRIRSRNGERMPFTELQPRRRKSIKLWQYALFIIIAIVLVLLSIKIINVIFLYFNS